MQNATRRETLGTAISFVFEAHPPAFAGTFF